MMSTIYERGERERPFIKAVVSSERWCLRHRVARDTHVRRPSLTTSQVNRNSNEVFYPLRQLSARIWASVLTKSVLATTASTLPWLYSSIHVSSILRRAMKSETRGRGSISSSKQSQCRIHRGCDARLRNPYPKIHHATDSAVAPQQQPLSKPFRSLPSAVIVGSDAPAAFPRPFSTSPILQDLVTS